MQHDAYRANILRQKVSNLIADGKHRQALTAADEAVAYPLASLPQDPLNAVDDIDAQAAFDWALGLMQRGVACRCLGKHARGRESFDRAERMIAILRMQHPMDENSAAHALVLNNRANLRSDAGDLPGALADLTSAIDIRRELAGRDPDERERLAGSLKNRSGVLVLLGQLGAAVTDVKDAVAIRRRRMIATADPTKRHLFAMTLYSYAHALAQSGEKTEAAQALGEAIQILERMQITKRSWPAMEADLETCRQLLSSL